MYWRRNPDIDIRRLERDYQNSGSIYDAAQLMTFYFRAGEIERSTELLQIIKDQYARAGDQKDLGLEAIIVRTHLGLGRKSADLCDGVVCRYDKTIIWDVKRNYPIGTTQGWINEINAYLLQMGWVDSAPILFKDILHPSHEAAFEAQKTMYAIALFHETEDVHENDAWIRVIWKNVYLPKIEADIAYRESFLDEYALDAYTDIMLEDEPITSDYAGPKICAGYIKQASSGGRSTSGASFTLRVPLQIGVQKALLTMEKLAYRIYFAKNWQEAMGASGITLYWPD